MRLWALALLCAWRVLGLRPSGLLKRAARATPLFATQQLQLTSDGGVVKDVLVPGTGKKVETGDILAVEYVARVGTRVIAKGEKEKFVLKDGSLIKGWDIGVGSMQVGEKARILCQPSYAYGEKGVGGADVVPGNAEVELEVKVMAWLGNQLRPETLFSKDLDIDPFLASTPEAIQAEFNDMQEKAADKYQGGWAQVYLNRIKNISFGFGGSGFFASQSAAFIVVLTTGSVKEKGQRPVRDYSEESAKVFVQNQPDGFLA